MFDLAGKVAIVTGGNGGIGLGMARGLAGAGASIVVAARNAEKSARAIGQLRQLRGQAEFIAVDVREESSVKALVDQTARRFGRIDILINNAGINVRKPPQDIALDEWNAVIETNLTSAYLCSRFVHPEMKKARRRQDRQYRLHDVDLRCVLRAGLCRQQGRHRAVHPRLRHRLGRRQHPGQCRAARLDRHRSDPPSARTGRGIA
jgi:NAD(P)-dependent dehydrogenase (short-subunit alcohol dehydrogenase family)